MVGCCEVHEQQDADEDDGEGQADETSCAATYDCNDGMVYTIECDDDGDVVTCLCSLDGTLVDLCEDPTVTCSLGGSCCNEVFAG